jgi:hypothetical protein
LRLADTFKVALILLFMMLVSACQRPKHDPAALVPEQDTPLVSVVNVNDPAASAQLVRGFYALESGTWRWTMKKFEVALKPPAGAAENGARLDFRFTIPEVIFTRMGEVTVSATINGLALRPETYLKPGDYMYVRDVPAAALKGDAVAVEFTSDKGIAPTAEDAHEFALVAVAMGLEPAGLPSK